MQTGRRQPDPHDDPASLAQSLEPALREACGGRLVSEIEWFQATWQRGGAVTGNAVWREAGTDPLPVVIKLPVSDAELHWTRRLGDHGSDRDVVEGETPHPTPRVLDAGETLGGYDLGWLVIERLEGSPVAGDLSEASLTGLIRAAAEFHYRAAEAERAAGERLHGRVDERDWSHILELSREAARDNALPEEHRWIEAIRHTHKRLHDILALWDARPMEDWCHGDLHPGNALHMPGENGHPDRCVLIDLALVHRGHWVEDAVYLERIFWGHEDRLLGVQPVRGLRHERRRRGMPVGPDDGHLANAKRVLTAAAVPARMTVEGGDEAYLLSALDHLERLLPTL